MGHTEGFGAPFWDGDRISVTHIRELRSWFNGATDVAPIIQKLDLILERKLTSKELRELEELRQEVEANRKKIDLEMEKIMKKTGLSVKIEELESEIMKLEKAVTRLEEKMIK